MSPRTIAVGDVHGHSAALTALIDAINPAADDTIITLGDYVDQGPDSRGVLEQLVALGQTCRLVPLMGNHEEMMLDAFENPARQEQWMAYGGRITLDSYGLPGELQQVPKEHLGFLEQLRLYFETETHFFVHGNYVPNMSIDRQPSQTVLWLPLDDLPGPHYSEKVAVLGHTPQKSGKLLDLGYLKCIDTGCGYAGRLTALDVGSGHVWQVNEMGTTVSESLLHPQS